MRFFFLLNIWTFFNDAPFPTYSLQKNNMNKVDRQTVQKLMEENSYASVEGNSDIYELNSSMSVAGGNGNAYNKTTGSDNASSNQSENTPLRTFLLWAAIWAHENVIFKVMKRIFIILLRRSETETYICDLKICSC